MHLWSDKLKVFAFFQFHRKNGASLFWAFPEKIKFKVEFHSGISLKDISKYAGPFHFKLFVLLNVFAKFSSSATD